MQIKPCGVQMSKLTEEVRKALEGFNNSRLDNAEIEYFDDSAPTWLAALCDLVEALELVVEASESLLSGMPTNALGDYDLINQNSEWKLMQAIKALRGSEEK